MKPLRGCDFFQSLRKHLVDLLPLRHLQSVQWRVNGKLGRPVLGKMGRQPKQMIAVGVRRAEGEATSAYFTFPQSAEGKARSVADIRIK